jgi:hypothetical protein
MKEIFFTLGFIFIFLGGILAASFGAAADFLSDCFLNNPGSLHYSFFNGFYLKTIEDFKQDLISENESFLEVNLSEMKVKAYRAGALFKEFAVLAKGDVETWGGSALGFYKVIGGNEFGYSGISEVYMPYSLHYYGKYYIHGEPYYPNGDDLISSVSGGCIRLSTKDAEEVYEFAEIGMPLLVLAGEKDRPTFIDSESSELNNVSAESYLAADLVSGFVFSEKDPKEQLHASSVAKLMTALVVAENVDLGKSITVNSEMLQAYGSTKGLKEGESFRVVELLYPLLMESSNDAAQVLSGFLGKIRTVEMMNEKTKSMLMENSRFVDSHGFGLENVSCAQDMFQMARYLFFTKPPLLEITKGKEVRSFGGISFDIEEMANENVFFKDPDFIGGKAGYSGSTGDSGLFIFRIPLKGEERVVAIALLGSKDLKGDTQKIYQWVGENYSVF